MDGFGTDHRVIHTVLDLDAPRDQPITWSWRSLDKKKARPRLAAELQKLGQGALETPEGIDNYLDSLMEAIKKAIVPVDSQRQHADTSFVHDLLHNSRAQPVFSKTSCCPEKPVVLCRPFFSSFMRPVS